MIANVEAPRAPHAVEPVTFPLPALAGLAAKAPIGGSREIVLACFLTARAAIDATMNEPRLSGDQTKRRAQEIASWLASSPMASNVKGPLLRFTEAIASGEGKAVRSALESVIMVTANHLDSAARLELARVAQAVDR